MGLRKQRQCTLALVTMVTAALVLSHWTLKLIQTSSWLPALLTGVVAIVMGLVSLVTWDVKRLNPADSLSLRLLIIQYLFTRILVPKKAKNVLRTMETESQNVKDCQRALLHDILHDNAETEYGRKHVFTDITNVEQFQEFVPLQKYDAFKGYISRIKEEGTQGILCSDDVIFLAMTSGTTGEYKCVPITRTMKFKDGMKAGPVMFYSQNRKAGLDLQRILLIKYKPTVFSTPSGLEMAPVSYHMDKPLPFRLIPEAAKDIADEQMALYVNAVFGLRDKEVGFIELLMATLMYSFWRMVEERWREVCEDIASGRLSRTLRLDPHLETELNRLLTPDPARARELRGHFTRGFHGIAKRIWPNLRGVRMLATGSFAHYARVLRESYMQGIPQLSLAHAGSEAIMGLNIEPEHDVHLYTLVTQFVFYEFIPEEHCHETQPETLLAHQLEVGGVYELVLTTRMGLYRYRIGDVIRVVKFYGQCPVYEFMYRVGQVLNLYWEKTPENIFYSSVQKTADDLGVTLEDYTATEDIHLKDVQGQESTNGNGTKKYVLFIEVTKNGGMYRLTNQEACQFDKTLCESFDFYSDLRFQRSIDEMQVFQVKRGTFGALKKRIIEKTQNQQFKMPRVMRNVYHLKFLLENSLVS